MEFKSTHNLTFYDAPSAMSLLLNSLNPGKEFEPEELYRQYKIGTCHGLWNCVNKCYVILAIMNDEPGNGHFTDVLEIFENSAKRDGYSVLIKEIWNRRLEKHLIEKKGYKKIKTGCIKYFHKK